MTASNDVLDAGAEALESEEKKAKKAEKKARKEAEKALEAEAAEAKALRKAEKKAEKKARKEAKAAKNGNGTHDEAAAPPKKEKLKSKVFDAEMARLHEELVALQYWVKEKDLKVVVLFEGRDAAGKGGVIKTISDCLNPRGCRTVALGTPTEREKGQWYFQRYVQHLPAAGEIVLFDRSWYNRSGVERVMGFCTKDQYREFLHSCPEFERMLVRSGIILLKYWFSVSDAEQEKRFHARAENPAKRWKLSPMDVEARSRWVEFSKAKDQMFEHTDIKEAPWFVVDANDKKRARLNCITHLLSKIHYEDVVPRDPVVLPPRQDASDYVRPPISEQKFVPEVF